MAFHGLGVRGNKLAGPKWHVEEATLSTIGPAVYPPTASGVAADLFRGEAKTILYSIKNNKALISRSGGVQKALLLLVLMILRDAD